MTKTEFIEKVAHEVNEFMPVGVSTEIQPIDVMKNNGVIWHGICIREGAVGMNIYLDNAYEAYEDGESFEEILSNIANQFVEEMDAMHQATAMVDFDNPDLDIAVKLVNVKRNEEMLNDTPHIDVGHGLALIAQLNSDGYRLTITDVVLDKIGISKDELFTEAINNSELNRPLDILRFGFGDYYMDVLKTDDVYGASALFYPSSIQKICDHFKQSVYLIPSSVHEWIAVATDRLEPYEINSMITQCNASVVSEEEILLDHALLLDIETGMLSDVA